MLKSSAECHDLHSVGDTNTLNTGGIDSLVKREQIDEIGAERVLGRESDLDTLAGKEAHVSVGSAQSGSIAATTTYPLRYSMTSMAVF